MGALLSYVGYMSGVVDLQFGEGVTFCISGLRLVTNNHPLFLLGKRCTAGQQGPQAMELCRRIHMDLAQWGDWGLPKVPGGWKDSEKAILLGAVCKGSALHQLPQSNRPGAMHLTLKQHHCGAGMDG